MHLSAVGAGLALPFEFVAAFGGQGKPCPYGIWVAVGSKRGGGPCDRGVAARCLKFL